MERTLKECKEQKLLCTKIKIKERQMKEEGKKRREDEEGGGGRRW